MGYRNAAGKGQISFPAGADLTAKRGYFVKLNASAQLVLCVAGGAGAIGVLEDCAGAAVGSICSISPLDGRVVEVKSGASLTNGDPITSDANGAMKAVVTNSVKTDDAGVAADPVLGSNVLGYVLATCANNEIVSAYVYNFGAVPGTAS